MLFKLKHEFKLIKIQIGKNVFYLRNAHCTTSNKEIYFDVYLTLLEKKKL